MGTYLWGGRAGGHSEEGAPLVGSIGGGSIGGGMLGGRSVGRAAEEGQYKRRRHRKGIIGGAGQAGRGTGWARTMASRSAR